MLDPRIYRVSFLPVLLAMLVVAFALQDRPRPIGTTLAPDAFGGRQAGALLDELAQDYPDRRPGSAGDEALARRVEGSLTSALRAGSGSAAPDPIVKVTRVRGARTIDGRRDITNVIATRPGRPGPGIVLVAHRDASGPVAKAELSGTAALLTLAQIIGRGRLRRTVTFVSTSGGSGGAAGVRAAIADLPESPDAVLVLGDMASVNTSRPFVVGYSAGRGVAPPQLRRTVETAARREVGDPGGPRAAVQFARQAFPLTVGEQGTLGKAGLPAVLLSATGERGPAADAEISRRQLQRFGRAALRAVNALNNGPTIGGGPEPSLQIARKMLSGRTIRLFGGALLLPVLLVTIDGFARARRRREPVGRRLAWVAATAFPFALTAAAAFAGALVGLIDPAPRLPVPVAGLAPDGAALAAGIALVLIFALAWVVLRPLLLRLAGQGAGQGKDTAAPAIAVLVVSSALATVIWVLNPFAAAVMAPALHLWLFATTPDWRWPRPVRLLAVLLGLVPFALIAWVDASGLGYGLRGALWQGVLLVAGGHVGPLTWLLWSGFAGCAVCAAIVAVHPSERPVDRGKPGATGKPSQSIRGPGGYVGPGSLGAVGTGSRR